MKILIKNGHVLDPSQKLDGVYDLLIDEGKIIELKKEIHSKDVERTIDASGKYVVPGLIDIHVHLREPGFEYKETIQTGGAAAVAGGFTSIVCMPNTNPVIDNKETIDYIYSKAEDAKSNIFMMGAITKGLDGLELCDYKMYKDNGINAITDDGKTVKNSGVMYNALKEAKELDMLVSVHCEDEDLVTEKSINKGKTSEELGLEGILPEAEEIIIERDIFLAESTGARLHVQHLSSKKGLELVKSAKARGLRVTCEATPHHFTITDEIVKTQGANGKMSPPLRSKEDVAAIIRGIIDGHIDVIATDHAPHSEEDKAGGLIKAANGILGLETSLGLATTFLIHDEGMKLYDLIDRMSCTPAKLLKLDKGSLKEGKDADITIIDLEKKWTVDKNEFKSKSQNTPFHGMDLRGKAICTIVKGAIKYSL